MRHWSKAGLILAIMAPSVGGQVVERDVKVTGPRGRTIERQVRTERGPGYVERQVDIKRPAGEYRSDVIVERGPRPGPQPAFRGGYEGGRSPRPIVVEEDVFIAPLPPPPAWGWGWGPSLSIGAPFFGLAIGSAPPPPVYYPPPPPPVVVVNPPQRYAPAPPPETVVVDRVGDAIGLLQSYHASSRRDGALALGRMGDARGVPPLVDRLKNDYDKDVRVASAWSLSEIGDPRAGVALERAALFDRRQDVREAAAKAYRRLPKEGAAPVPAAAGDARPQGASPADPEGRRDTPPPPPVPAEPAAFREGS